MAGILRPHRPLASGRLERNAHATLSYGSGPSLTPDPRLFDRLRLLRHDQHRHLADVDQPLRGHGQWQRSGARPGRPRQPRRQRRPRMRVVGLGRRPVADHQDRRDRAGRRRHRIQRRRQPRSGEPTRRHRVERTARRGEPGGRRVRLFAVGGIGQLPAGGRRRAVRGPRLQRPVLVDGAVRCRLGLGAGRCQQPWNRHSSVRRRGGRRPDTHRHDHRRRAPLQHRPDRCELYFTVSLRAPSPPAPEGPRSRSR